MPDVWFIGFSSRTISSQDWAEFGIQADEVTWNSYNGWSIPHSVFSNDQLAILDSDGQFLIGQTGPRLFPEPRTLDDFSKSGYIYYKRIMEIYDAVIDVAQGPQGEPGTQGPPGTVPVRFSTPTAIIGVSSTDYCYVARTLTNARMRVSSPPVGSPLTVQVQHWNGFTWTTFATMSIPGSSVIEATASFSQVQNAGDMVRINCTSIGSTMPATGVIIDVN